MANFSMKEINDEIHVRVTVPFNPNVRTYQGEKVYTSDVYQFLDENGIKYGKMLISFILKLAI